MTIKRITALLSSAILAAGLLLASGAAVPADEAGVTLATDNMSLSWDENGAVSSVVLQGKECIVNTASGFLVTDADSGKKYDFVSPLTGGSEKKQSGDLGDSNLKMEVTYRQEGHAIYVNGTVTDTSGADRLVRVDYRLPVSAEGMYWYDDISSKTQVKVNGDYSMPLAGIISGHKMSLYPYGTVSNGEQAVAFGVPMDPPQSYLISYKNTRDMQGMTVRFNFALSDKAPKVGSAADFSFVIYAPSEPEWGFRSASQDYYDLFPESFASDCRGGNWIFQHRYYSTIDGVEDFYLGYDEAQVKFAFDREHGIYTLTYTAPSELWMTWPGMPRTPEPTYDEYLAHLMEMYNDTTGAMEAGSGRIKETDFAEAVLNSAIHLDNGKFHTVGWYAYGVSVCFVTNGHPEIPGWNTYNVNVEKVRQTEEMADGLGEDLDGVYIDNLSGLGNLDFREEHFQYTDTPLLWDNQSKRLAMPGYSSQYSYTKAMRERCDERNQIIMANMVYPEKGIAQYIGMVDVPGSECGPDWGWEPYVQRLRRTMAYRKPWLLLLGHGTGNYGNLGGSVAELTDKENVMKSSIAYGLFANIIGYNVALEEYENVRPLFRKYTYIAVMQDELGWSPVTYAAAEGAGYADCERFGELGTGAAIFTVYNTGEQKSDFTGEMKVDLNALKVSADRAGELAVYDLLNNKYLPARIRDGVLSYDVNLPQLDLSAVMIGTKEEIFARLFEKMQSTIQRGDRASESINRQLTEAEIDPPARWTELSEALSEVSAYKDMEPALAFSRAAEMAERFKAAADASQGAMDALDLYANLLRVDVQNIYGDACAVLSGLLGAAGDADGDGQITSTDARLTLQLAVEKITEADVPNPGALDVDGDGTVTTTDARLILQVSVGKIDAFPAA